MSNGEEDLTEVKLQLKQLTGDVRELKALYQQLAGQHNMVQLLAKWVIAPLIVILGALVGIKLILPTA